MGCLEFMMEFPKNIAEHLDGSSEAIVRAWRHQMICKLIDAGITKPKEIQHTVDSLYNFIVSPGKNNDTDNTQPEKSDSKLIADKAISVDIYKRQINGIDLLNKLIDQAGLTKDQLEDIEFYLNPSSFLNSKKV